MTTVTASRVAPTRLKHGEAVQPGARWREEWGMTMHDPFVGMGYGWGRRVRWPGAGHGVRVRAPYRRKLAAIERGLMADTPALSAKFAMFNDLAGGEPPAGAERLPAPALRGPRAMYLAMLLAVAAVVTMCLALTAQVRTAVSPCHAAAVTGTSAQTPARGTSCSAYAQTKR
jgi:hypothetical protein